MTNFKYISACLAAGLIFSASVSATAEAEPTEDYKQCFKEQYDECMILANDLPFCLINARLMCRGNSAGGASASGSFAPHQGGGSPLGKPAKPRKGMSLKPKADTVRKRNRKFQAKTWLKPAAKPKANTVRKGNRKVSVTVSGIVSNNVYFPSAKPKPRIRLRSVQSRMGTRARITTIRRR
jgi:hypothetical protein